MAVEGDPATEEGMFTLSGQRHHTTGHSTDEDDACQRIADKVRDAAVAELKPLNYWSSAFKADRVDVYHLRASDGKSDVKKSATFEGSDANWGAATDSLPWESSIVVGLYAYPVGSVDPDRRSKRGRIFLPAFAGGTVDSNGSGELHSAILNSFLGPAVVSFLSSIQGVPLSDAVLGNDSLNLGVLSRTYNRFSQLEYVNIGSKFHHQRRRQVSNPAVTFGNTIPHS
jgi:hypothetical protein